MKIVEFKIGPELSKIGIPVKCITGFNELPRHIMSDYYKCFISTGPQGIDGGDNGYTVAHTYEEVKAKLEAIEDV